MNLVKPDPERDAPFAVEWFSAEYGRDTLLRMGNAEHEIRPVSLVGEQDRIRSFQELEKAGKQLTWMIRQDDKTIGAVWINLEDTEKLRAPAVHIMIGNRDYRGQGIGKQAIAKMIEYATDKLHADTLYSRHLVANETGARLLTLFGFKHDGASYTDDNGLQWQNVALSLRDSVAIAK